MLEQLMELMEEQYGDTLEQRILDEYIPADGTYIIVEKRGEKLRAKEPVHIKYDKTEKKIDEAVTELEFIRYADYNSVLVDMNKPVDKKKLIHSNNYLAFFVKKPNITIQNGEKTPKLNDDIIHEYYETLRNPEIKHEKSKHAKRLYESVDSQIGKPDTMKIGEIESWIGENLEQYAAAYHGKDYLKFFFRYGSSEEWKREYKQEGQRYILPNVFNSNDYNRVIGDRTLGLSNDNMGLNAKKPYLENKTRAVTVPYLIDMEMALFQKGCFDYLMNQAAVGKTNVYIGTEIKICRDGQYPEFDDGEAFNGLFLRTQKGKELEILDFDVIARYCTKLDKPFVFRNYLKKDAERLRVEYGIRVSMQEIEVLLHEVLFEKKLIYNYFREAKDLKLNDQVLCRNLILARRSLFDWFRKGNLRKVYRILQGAAYELTVRSIEKGNLTQAVNRFNLKLSIDDYFEGGERMGDFLVQNCDDLLEKLDGNEICGIGTDAEYYFAVGQLVAYLHTKSKARKVSLELCKEFMSTKNDEVIKDRIKRLLMKYAYDISGQDVRLKKLASMVLGYRPEGKVQNEKIICGYLANNVIFMKKKS